jgi:medium-chain acyl-[acyl-carrier-protein] hydrolase
MRHGRETISLKVFPAVSTAQQSTLPRLVRRLLTNETRMNATRVGPWVFSPCPRRQPRLRIICFPGAGAGGAAFRDWWDWPDTDIEICSVQLPGRESRIHEPPISTFPELTPVIAASLQPWIGQPYIFLGHSLGAWIAFEVARELRRLSRPGPRHLFVAAAAAPHLPWPHPPIRELSDHELLNAVDRRYHSIPLQVFEDRDLRALVAPGLRADFSLVETYQYRESPPLECPISVFGGDRDSTVSFAKLEAWRQQTCGNFRVQTLAGDHFVLGALRLRLLTNEIIRELEQSMAPPVPA